MGPGARAALAVADRPGPLGRRRPHSQASRTAAAAGRNQTEQGMTDRIAVSAPLAGTIVSVVADGANVRAGEELIVVESMKMHHAVTAPVGGVMWSAGPAVGDVVA